MPFLNIHTEWASSSRMTHLDASPFRQHRVRRIAGRVELSIFGDQVVGGSLFDLAGYCPVARPGQNDGD